MRNKIALINFPDQFEIDADANAHLYYEIVMFNNIKEFILCQYHGILFYNPEIQNLSSLNFFTKIHTFNEKTIKSLKNNLLQTLDTTVGRERLVNPRQFEIIKGSVVRNKVDNRLGPGIVVDLGDNGNVRVNFPEAKNYYRSNIVICHKSHLRVITTIEEVKRNEEESKQFL